jgi:hypothetical protein
VTSADAAELHGKYANTPYQSNRVLGVLSKMMNLAEVWGMRDRRTSSLVGAPRESPMKHAR